MSTSALTLIQRTRRFVRDWPDQDALTASTTSIATTLTVADSSIYKANWPIEIDQETMLVRTAPSVGTTLTVLRGAYASTPASHANGAAVLVRPHFFSVEILDALNYGLDRSFPLMYKPVLDTSLSILSNTYEYTIPNLTGSQPIWAISSVEILQPGDYAYRTVTAWDVLRGATSKLKFRRLHTTSSTVRIRGYGPFPHLATITDTLDAQWPYHAEYPLVEFAGSVLLESGEARRVRVDTGPVDQRENANRTGSSLSASNALLARYERSLLIAAMPPMPRHVQPTL